ncbi:hypothetical protein [Pseudomonas sp. AOB-7]|uniref:hypothetical protein n=1 Tax=Pseudomonas sp. AOB-7 TaxID=2482750 RepID=UPI0011C3C54A|nr:hypothetical protein [Pseudomonas sp. AOB-7]
MSNTIQNPTPEFIRQYLSENSTEEFFGAESALGKLFKMFPSNKNFDEVLLKVTCLNDLYQTNVYATYRLAKNIHGMNIDSRLKKGDLSLVTDIEKNGLGNRRVYSFATKYCSWHNQDAYPIYDKYAANLLHYYLKSVTANRATKKSLLNYSDYVSGILALKEHYRLKKISIKKLDKFLWLYGKQSFP